MFSITSDIPKSPITTGINPTPSIRTFSPKVNLGLPTMKSIPMVPKKRPKAAIIIALSMEPLARKETITRPRHMREKYSGKPNRRAKLARGGAISMRPRMLIVPPMKEPKAEIPKAGPALPWRAI